MPSPSSRLQLRLGVLPSVSCLAQNYVPNHLLHHFGNFGDFYGLNRTVRVLDSAEHNRLALITRVVDDQRVEVAVVSKIVEGDLLVERQANQPEVHFQESVQVGVLVIVVDQIPVLELSDQLAGQTLG